MKDDEALKFGIRGKIALPIVLGFVLTFASIIGVQFFYSEKTAEHIGLQQHTLMTQILANQMSAAVRFRDGDRLSQIYSEVLENETMSFVRVSQADGTVLSEHGTAALSAVDKAHLEKAFENSVNATVPVTVRIGNDYAISVPLTADNSSQVLGVLSIGWSDQSIVKLIMSDTLYVLLIASLLPAIGLASIMYLVGRLVTQPILALGQTMKNVSERDFTADVPYLERYDELGQIARRLREFRDDLAFESEERRSRAAEDQKAFTLFDRLSDSLSKVARGDTSVRIDPGEFDDLSERHQMICSNFNGLVDGLESVVSAINAAAETVRINSLEISQVATDQSRRSEAQAATLEESAAALESLTTSVKATAEHAAEADEQIQANRSQAEASGHVVVRTVEAMQKIEASSEQITEIIGVIDDIAFQTNLLALNAGVEAARAGEAGRGFSVVASEVRALAQRASDSAHEIKELIGTSGQHVAEGGALVSQTGEALNQIIHGVAKVSNIVSSIAGASLEQSNNLAEINQAINELDKVTQQNAAVIEETSAASSALSHEAERLTDALVKYRRGETIGIADQTTGYQAKVAEPPTFGDTQSNPTQMRKTVNGTVDEGWQDF